MARELHKCLINYFGRLRILDGKWKELAREAERPLQALGNQTEQLRLVSRKEKYDAELCKVEDLRDRLIFKIRMGIEREMTLLLDICARFNNANQDLNNRLRNLEEARSRVNVKDKEMQDLIDGSAYRPRLNLLLEWAIDGYKYYNELYLRVRERMKELDYNKEETVENLIGSFAEDRFKRTKINFILGFTQFLAKETVR